MKKTLMMPAGFTPLSRNEECSTRGGAILGLILVAAAAAAVTEIITDWDNFKNGLMGRPEEK